MLFSIRWYEPLLPRCDGGDETLSVIDGNDKSVTLVLPKGRGWHEQTTRSEAYARNLHRALSRKGYVLIETRKYIEVSGLKIDQ